jgi:trk system potassium uptake protein TrkH
VVFKYFGQLCLVLAVLTMVPLVISLIFGESYIALRYAIVVCRLAGLGLGTARLRAPSSVQANEGMVLVTLMFLFTPLAMS